MWVEKNGETQNTTTHGSDEEVPGRWPDVANEGETVETHQTKSGRDARETPDPLDNQSYQWNRSIGDGLTRVETDVLEASEDD